MSVETAVTGARAKRYMSFVVPPPSLLKKGGHFCNEECSGCWNGLANEVVGDKHLTIAEYVNLVRVAITQFGVDMIGIHGPEALEPGRSWATVQAIAGAGRELGVPVNIVTNGTYLATRAMQLADLEISRVIVSIHAATADAHNAFVRADDGIDAFAAIESGVSEFLRHRHNKGRLLFTGVLMKKQHARFDGISKLLADWVGAEVELALCPFLTFGPKGGLAEEAAAYVATIKKHHDEGKDHGVNVRFDDTLDLFGETDLADDYFLKSLGNVVRVTPNPKAFAVSREQFLGREPRLTYAGDPEHFFRTHVPAWAF